MSDRIPHEALEARYKLACATPSDINEHLPVIREYASRCEHVTEFGMRGAVSTIALLAAMPETLISWDINPFSVISQTVADLVMLTHNRRTAFQPRVGDTLHISVIEPTELLFIDTLHTAKQLFAELMRHSDPMRNTVQRYLIFHDTETFGWKGEDGSENGLRHAIFLYQKNTHPLWKVVEDRPNNNGLVVLENLRWEAHHS